MGKKQQERLGVEGRQRWKEPSGPENAVDGPPHFRGPAEENLRREIYSGKVANGRDPDVYSVP